MSRAELVDRLKWRLRIHKQDAHRGKSKPHCWECEDRSDAIRALGGHP